MPLPPDTDKVKEPPPVEVVLPEINTGPPVELLKEEVFPEVRILFEFAMKSSFNLTVAPDIPIPSPAVKLVDTVLVVPEEATDIPVPAATVVIEFASIDCLVLRGVITCVFSVPVSAVL